MGISNREAVREGEKKSEWNLSVSRLVLSIAEIFSSSKKTEYLKAESSSVMRKAPQAMLENPAPLAKSFQDISRHEKSIIELIKMDFGRHRKEAIALGAILFLLSAFFFFSYMKAGVVLLSLTVMGAISRAWQRFFPLEFGIELVMLATVVSGVAYGAAAGLIVGFVSLVLSTILTQEDPGKMWPAFLTISIIGFLAGTLTIANIALWGVIFTVLYDAIISVIYISSGHSVIKTLIFDATHIAFNYFVFYHIAPAIVSMVI